MAMYTSWATEVRWQDTGIADAADPWRSRPESRSEADWLSASILHDLRNPLSTIYAGAEMLMTLHTTPNEVKRLAANMHRAAGRMRELLTDLTSLTYRHKSTPEICDLREIIVAASERAAAATDNRRVQILLDVPEQIELPLARARMKLMFFNLITNALEAMPGGGEVRIAATGNRDYVLVAIEDTGPGIPHEIRDKVFEPFVTAGKENGVGLGLAFFHQAVLDHGGDMWIEPAAGARFVIRFPLNGHQGSWNDLSIIEVSTARVKSSARAEQATGTETFLNGRTRCRPNAR
ncbi:MAG TPA: HAMP domain-containing sensor histidine kinase [Chthoniobacterales bacterium]|nr:HAMP domain-containing sensor histidine kinase [Chthoniobacterales bacterium]